jgi:hypothetical protein
MTAPATKTQLLLDRALEAMREREEKNEAYRREQAARERTRISDYAIAAWQQKLGITVAPSAVSTDGSVARTTSDGVNLAYRYVDGDRLYAEVPCPRRDESGDGETPLEHGYVMVDFHDLASLGDALTTEPRDDCFQCQERREHAREERTPAPAPLSPLERLTAAIQDVVEDTVRRSIEP